MPEGTNRSQGEAGRAGTVAARCDHDIVEVEHSLRGSTCAFWNLRGPAFAQILGPSPWGDTAGDIGVVFTGEGHYSSSGTYSYDPKNIDATTVSHPRELDGHWLLTRSTVGAITLGGRKSDSRGRPGLSETLEDAGN